MSTRKLIASFAARAGSFLLSLLLWSSFPARADSVAECRADCDKRVAEYGSEYWVKSQCYPKCGQPIVRVPGSNTPGGSIPGARTVVLEGADCNSPSAQQMRQSTKANLDCHAKCDAIPLTKFGSEYWRKVQCGDPCDQKFARYNIVCEQPQPAPKLGDDLAVMKQQYDLQAAALRKRHAHLDSMWSEALRCQSLLPSMPKIRPLGYFGMELYTCRPLPGSTIAAMAACLQQKSTELDGYQRQIADLQAKASALGKAECAVFAGMEKEAAKVLPAWVKQSVPRARACVQHPMCAGATWVTGAFKATIDMMAHAMEFRADKILADTFGQLSESGVRAALDRCDYCIEVQKLMAELQRCGNAAQKIAVQKGMQVPGDLAQLIRTHSLPTLQQLMPSEAELTSAIVQCRSFIASADKGVKDINGAINKAEAADKLGPACVREIKSNARDWPSCKALAQQLADVRLPVGGDLPISVSITGSVADEGVVGTGQLSVKADLKHPKAGEYDLDLQPQQSICVGGGTADDNIVGCLRSGHHYLFSITSLAQGGQVLGFLSRALGNAAFDDEAESIGLGPVWAQFKAHFFQGGFLPASYIAGLIKKGTLLDVGAKICLAGEGNAKGKSVTGKLNVDLCGGVDYGEYDVKLSLSIQGQVTIDQNKLKDELSGAWKTAIQAKGKALEKKLGVSGSLVLGITPELDYDIQCGLPKRHLPYDAAEIVSELDKRCRNRDAVLTGKMTGTGSFGPFAATLAATVDKSLKEKFQSVKSLFSQPGKALEGVANGGKWTLQMAKQITVSGKSPQDPATTVGGKLTMGNGQPPVTVCTGKIDDQLAFSEVHCDLAAINRLFSDLDTNGPPGAPPVVADTSPPADASPSLRRCLDSIAHEHLTGTLAAARQKFCNDSFQHH